MSFAMRNAVARSTICARRMSVAAQYVVSSASANTTSSSSRTVNAKPTVIPNPLGQDSCALCGLDRATAIASCRLCRDGGDVLAVQLEPIRVEVSQLAQSDVLQWQTHSQVLESSKPEEVVPVPLHILEQFR